MKFEEFLELGINQKIIDATDALGFDEPTPVQEKTIPLVHSKCDLLIQAPTGTGKTAAFAIPILNNIDTNSKSIQAVVLSPTRELTMQIAEEFKRLAKFMPDVKIAPIYGGQNMDRQLATLRKKPHIVVGTTGRVMDHLRRHTLKIHETQVIVLDEADEMLDMGFREDIDFILSKMMRDVQVLMFSATMRDEIMEISAEYQNDPLKVKTTCDGSELPPIEQFLVNVDETNKYGLLKHIIDEKNYKNVLVFCNTKAKCAEIAEQLNDEMYLSYALHGDLRQRERDKVMKAYRAHEINVLVATDVAARGIDVKEIEAIFNYDLPLDEEYYVHRIGRTSRAKANGVAYSFATKRDNRRLTSCEKAAGQKMTVKYYEGFSFQKSSEHAFGVPTTRFFLNVGKMDNAGSESLMAYFMEHTHIEKTDFYDVKLHDTYSFIEVDSKFADDILLLSGLKCFRRKLSVEISKARSNDGGSGRKPRQRSDGNRSGSSSRGDRPRRDFDKSDRPKRDFDKSDRPKRDFDNSDRPKRDFDKTDRPRRDFDKSDRPKRDFDNSDRPKRDFDKTDRPRRDFDKSDRPKRDFDKSDRPRRDFDKSDRPRKDFDKSDRPRRDFDKSDRPRRDFDKSDRPKRDFNNSDRPRRDFNNSDRPRRDFDKSDRPRRDFDKSDRPRRDFDKSDRPKRDFDKSDRPRRDFDKSDRPRRDFDKSDRPKRDFNKSDRPRRDFDGTRPPKRQFNADDNASRISRNVSGVVIKSKNK